MNKSLKIFWILTCYLFFNWHFSSGQIKSYSDTSAILIGQPLKLYFELEEGIELVKFKPNDTINGFILLSWFDTISRYGKSYLLSLTVTKFDTGYFEFQPLIFRKNSDTLFSEKIGVKILLPTLNEQIEIYDIKQNISFYNDLWILFLITGLLFISLLYMLFKKIQKNKIKQVQSETSISIELETIGKLELLLDQYLNSTIDARIFYFNSDEILRRYLEIKYEIKFLEFTTREVLKNLDKIPLSIIHTNLFKDFFKSAELVKFAKAADDKKNTEIMINNILEFLRKQESNNLEANKIQIHR